MSKDRDFKGVWIPKDIWLNTELTLLEKIIFVEIDSLDNENHCTAGNDYFAKFCNCSESAVSKAIKKLQDLEMIEVVSFDGRHRKLRVVNFTKQGSKIYEAESQNLLSNNIVNSKNNNKTISKDIVEKSPKTKKLSLWDKCVSAIDDFTEDNILRELLVASLKMFMENSRESGIAFYTNHFKGKLNNLKKLSEDNYQQRKIVQQTLDNGWNNFYELKENKRKTRDFSKDVEGLNEGLNKQARKGVKPNGTQY